MLVTRPERVLNRDGEDCVEIVKLFTSDLQYTHGFDRKILNFSTFALSMTHLVSVSLLFFFFGSSFVFGSSSFFSSTSLFEVTCTSFDVILSPSASYNMPFRSIEYLFRVDEYEYTRLSWFCSNYPYGLDSPSYSSLFGKYKTTDFLSSL